MNEQIYRLVACVASATGLSALAYAFARSYVDALDKTPTLSGGRLKSLLAPLGAALRERARVSRSIREMAERYDGDLVRAGRFWGGLNGYEVLAAKFAAPVLMAAAVSLGGLFAGFEMDVVFLFAAFFLLLGYLYPDAVLKARVRRRREVFMRQLPGGLDIIKVAAESGLDFHSSVKYLVDIYIPGPVKEEMRTFQRELKLGVPTVAALLNVAERVGDPEATTIFVSLSQAVEMGTSIVDMLEDTTREMRRKRLLSAESEAQKAVVKITFPLLLLILPGIFIILLAPVIKPMLQLFGNFAR